MKAKFAGHAALFLYDSDYVCAIDPWLEGNPMCPAELKNPEKLDLIVLTHGHGDHAGDVVRVHQQTGATVAAMFELAELLVPEGVSENSVIPMSKGGSVQPGKYRVSLTHALHSSSYDSPKRGTLYAGEPCGVVISDGETTVFHAGDTCLFSDLALIGKRYRPSVAFLPMGDHFTMGAEDAAEAARLLGVRMAYPIHYKTFPVLAQSADEFVRACNDLGIAAQEMTIGEEFTVG
ncbi:MAG TPA: metal-dependent hydrolase [Fimbriimonadaceae bacterium]|nr:metal-dependent hydrolase [Fimbriimonadaceae bacterium]